MTTLDKLRAEIELLGRPQFNPSSFKAMMESVTAAKEWDAAHPEGAAQYEALVARVMEYHETEQRERAEAHRRRWLEERAHASGLGTASLRAALSPKPTKAMTDTRAWFASDRLWLVLCGGVGVGKTVAATWAAWEALNAGATVAQRSAQEVARLSGFGDGAVDLDRLKRVGLLVLDDVGSEAATEWAKAVRHELLDARHEARRRTIITSNLGWRDLSKHLGPRIADRVQSEGTCVELSGPSMRGQR